ncbi:MAG: filamentous hemagglutinin N-terminal domain-containing protein [Verrucomicrobiae bacterium]|nr:filamentous hemagglutinin N-terminal domain-containing protein [Verrucomicrobiae bacterium]
MAIAKSKPIKIFFRHIPLFFFVPILQIHFLPTLYASPLPTGHQIIHGEATIAYTEKELNIVSHSNKTISQWESFNIHDGYRVNFSLPSPDSIYLNRVVGSYPSLINGLLTSNGSVYLINPNGILVGPNGTILTHGGLLSTLDVANDHFLQNEQPLSFTSLNPSSIHVLGKIHSSGETFTLLSPSIQIAESASIQAPNGHVQIASTDQATLLVRPDSQPHTYIRINTTPTQGDLQISGSITAQDISILASGNPYAHAIHIHPQAHITALGTENRGGRIWLYSPHGAILQQGQLLAPSGEIHLLSPRNKITQSGTLDASAPSTDSTPIRRATSVRGGLIDILADEIELTALARLLARGQAGGGTIRVGGSWQGNDRTLPHARNITVQKSALLDASSLQSGHGGTIVVWADHTNRCHGTLLALGAETGDGGRIEISGLRSLDFSGHVSTHSPSGHHGLLLLDPFDVEILNIPPTYPPGLNPQDPIWSSDEDPSITTLSASTLESLLKENTVHIEAKNNLTLRAPLSWQTSSGLSLIAGNDLSILAPITQSAPNSFSLGIHLTADSDDNGQGTLSILAPITQSHGELNLTAAKILIQAPLSVPNPQGTINALALHDTISTHSSTTPLLLADYIDLAAHRGIHGPTPNDPLPIQASLQIQATIENQGDLRLLNHAPGYPNDLIFIESLLAPQGSIHFTQKGGKSLYIGNTDLSHAIKAKQNLTLILESDPEKNKIPHLIIHRSIHADGHLLASSHGNITINPTATVGTPLSTGGNVTLAIGQANEAAFAQATLTNNGTIESGGHLHIHAAKENNVTLGKTKIAKQIHLKPSLLTPSPNNSSDPPPPHNSNDNAQASNSHHSSSSSHHRSSSLSSSSSASSSSSSRIEHFRSDFSRSSQSSSSLFSSAISQASSSSSSHFSSRYSHSQSQSGPLSSEARSSSSQSHSRASSSSQSNFSHHQHSASSSSSSYFRSQYPTFSLPPSASQQSSSPALALSSPPSPPRLNNTPTPTPTPLTTELPHPQRHTLAHDPNKLWIYPSYTDTITLSSEFLYPDSAISLGLRPTSLSINELPPSLSLALSPAIRNLLAESIYQADLDDSLPEPDRTPPPLRRRQSLMRPPPSAVEPLPERPSNPRTSSRPTPAPDSTIEKKDPPPPQAPPQPPPPTASPTPDYGSGVVLSDDGTTVPLDPSTIPPALQNAISRAIYAALLEAITADDYHPAHWRPHENLPTTANQHPIPSHPPPPEKTKPHNLTLN